MSATADSASFSTSSCLIGGGGSYYTITGTGVSSSEVLLFAGPLGSYLVGTYTINGTNNQAYYYPTSNTNNFKTAKSGTVTISSMVSAVSVIGTFNFVCTDGTTVSNGTFTAQP